MATMDVVPPLPVVYTYPNVYKLELESHNFDEILHLYVEEVFQGVNSSKVDSALVSYITHVIEPVGWKAIWRATKESSELSVECDFVVEVIDVSLTKLEADVIINSLLMTEGSELDLNVVERKIRQKAIHTVPLIELHPLSEGDEEEMYAKTAVAIEYVRFFCKYLLRPWDSEDEDVVYSEKLLKSRLQLYFDMQNKVLPDSMITRIREVLKEGWDAVTELKKLYVEMNVSDSEAELNDDDVLQSLVLRKKLDEVQREMELLENPVIRTLVMKKYVPHKSPQKLLPHRGPVTYLVAQQFTYAMITRLVLEPSTVVEFKNSPESATVCCSSGDTILIFPGHYRCDNLGWLNGEVEIRGLGSFGSVKLIATGNSEIFLNCHSPSLTVSNVIFKGAAGVVSTIVVHHGKLHLQNCLIDNDGAETGVTVLGGAEALLESTEICNSQEDGIQLRSSSTLTLKSSKVMSCAGHGLNLEGNDDAQFNGKITELNILDSFVVDNEGCGIFINAAREENTFEESSGDVCVLNIFPWLKHKIENSTICHNKQSEIGLLTCVTCPEEACHPRAYIDVPDGCFSEENYTTCDEVDDIIDRCADVTIEADKLEAVQ